MAKARRARRKPQAAAVPPTWRGLPLYAATFVAALALRLLYVSSIGDSPFFSNLQTNALRYHQWASLIVDGAMAPRPPFDQPPGYAYFVALIYASVGRSMTAITTAQAGLDALTCVLIAHLTRIWFGFPSALVAALLATACAPLIYFCGELLPATFALAIAVAAVAATLHSRWLVAGGLWALSLTLRSEMLLALPFIAFDAAWRGGRSALWRTGTPPALVLAAFLSANALGSGHFVPLTIGSGVNLWIGNNPHADGVNPFLFGPLAAEADVVRQQAAGDHVAADRMFRQRAFAFWREQPLRAARLLLKKLLWTWARRELPNTSDIEWQTGHSWLFRSAFFPIGFGLIVPPAFAGMILARRRLRQLLPGVALLAVGTVTCTLFFTNARFRLILVPVLIAMAAHWLAALPQLRRGKLDKLSFAGLALGLLLAWGNFYNIRDYSIAQVTANTGILEREAGRYPAAARHLRRAVSAEPGDAIAWGHLALALEQMGLVDDAITAYLDGLMHNRDSADLHNLARRSFVRNRVPESMLATYLDAGDATQRETTARAIHEALRNAR